MFQIFKPKPEPKPESPAAMLKRVEAEAEAERIQMKLADEKRERAEKIRAEQIEKITANAITAKTENEIRREQIADKLINFGPLFLISGLAIAGQFGYFGDALSDTFGEIFAKFIGGACALALELIALFLGLHAMRALRRGDSAAALLLGATGVAGLVAWMNFEHFADEKTGAPSVASYAFALFSFAAPFLWRIKIRADHRDDLAAKGEIEKRALKLPRVMWTLHPIKSYKVYRFAAWTGERDVTIAIKDWESSRKTDEPTVIETAPEIDAAHMLAMIENLRLDLQSATGERPELPHVPQPRPELPPADADEFAPFIRHAKWNEGVATYEASIDSGSPLKVQDLAAELGMSNRVLAGKIKKFVDNNRERIARERRDSADLATETA